MAGTENLTVTGNFITNWAEGAYIVIGTTGSIDHNVFAGNGNGVVTELVDLVISDNSFEDSVGAHIALAPFAATATVADFVFDNNFLDLDAKPNPISIFPNGGAGQEIFGSDVAESFRGDSLSGPFTFHGGGGNDIAIGSTGDDIFFGDAGNDTIDGGVGTDTAAYTATTITAAMVDDDGLGHFVVTTGGADGTDTLSGIEIIDGVGTSNILLVGSGGFTTIQAAIDAAAAGDTIMIAAGNYDEDIVVDKDVTILGANAGVRGTAARAGGICHRLAVSTSPPTASPSMGSASPAPYRPAA